MNGSLKSQNNPHLVMMHHFLHVVLDFLCVYLFRILTRAFKNEIGSS